MNTTPETSTPQPRRQWSSKSVGSKLQHEIFYTLIRIGGRPAAYTLLKPVAAWYAIRPDIRRRAFPYVRHRFPGVSNLQATRHIFHLYHNFGKTLIDRAVAGILGSGQFQVHFPQQQLVLELLEQKRGLIIINSHVGCWQLAMSALPHIPVPVHMLIHREPGDIDRHYHEHSSGQTPFNIIDPTTATGASLQLVDALKRGEVVNLMGDRIFGSSKHAVAVPFLGEEAAFPTTAYKLAAATGAPCLILLSAKTGPAAYTLRVPRIIEVPAGTSLRPRRLRPYLSQYVETLEAYCKEYPYQFYNFFDLWAPPT